MPLARIALRLYFREISISGLEHVPHDRPVIIASNHPSAFIEPCILASLLPRKLYFMARGDIFVKPLFIKMLGSLNILPIYRFRDGFGKLKKNEASFAEAFRILGQQQAALHILVEGRTRQIKHLEPLQKGAARIAFGTKRLFPDQPIDILPVGITFGTPNTPRDTIMISIGQPIAVDDFLPDNQEDERTAITTLTKHLRDALKQELVHIVPKDDEAHTERLLIIDRTNRYRNWSLLANRSRAALTGQQQVVKWRSSMTEEGRQALDNLSEEYFQRLERLQITDLAVGQPTFLNPGTIFALLLFGPLFLASCLLNIWPILVADAITRQRVRETEFVASVNIALYLVVFLIYLPILGLLAGQIFGLAAAVLVPLGAVVSGVPSLVYRDHLVRSIQILRYKRLPKPVQAELVDARSRLICPVAD